MLSLRPYGADSVSRREFLRRSAALAGLVGLPTVVPSSALGLGGATAPSNRMTLGCIGMGIQGLGNMRTFRGNKDVQVVAVCDVHETRRLAAKQAVDEFYENKDCAAYKDFRELIGHKDIDAVQITAPDHWHPIIAVEAARRGKHMYCEKPIGWSFRAAQVLRKVIKETGVYSKYMLTNLWSATKSFTLTLPAGSYAASGGITISSTVKNSDGTVKLTGTIIKEATGTITKK